MKQAVELAEKSPLLSTVNLYLRNSWYHKTIRNFIARRLLVPIFDAGQLVYESPSAQSIKRYCKGQVETLWEEVQRFEKPHKYYVDYSEKLWNLRQKLLSEKRV